MLLLWRVLFTGPIKRGGGRFPPGLGGSTFRDPTTLAGRNSDLVATHVRVSLRQIELPGTMGSSSKPPPPPSWTLAWLGAVWSTLQIVALCVVMQAKMWLYPQDREKDLHKR